MHLLSFDLGSGPVRLGALLSGERVLDLTNVYPTALALLEGGQHAMQTVRGAVQRAEEGAVLAGPIRPLEEIRFLPPVPQARKLIALAGNYQEHNREQGRAALPKETTYPHLFLKPPSTTLTGHRREVPFPAIARKLDYEGELAVVIGRRGRPESAAEAMDFVAGYTVLNDLSERAFHAKDGEITPRERDPFFNWLMGKWFDGGAPCGPWMVTADALPDPHRLALRTWVNGELRQDGNTAQMVFTIPEILVFCGRVMTLEPGDLIATGTPSGVGGARGLALQPGDCVEVEIEGIGRLCTTLGPRP